MGHAITRAALHISDVCTNLEGTWVHVTCLHEPCLCMPDGWVGHWCAGGTWMYLMHTSILRSCLPGRRPVSIHQIEWASRLVGARSTAVGLRRSVRAVSGKLAVASSEVGRPGKIKDPGMSGSRERLCSAPCPSSLSAGAPRGGRKAVEHHEMLYKD